jgi:hypothetical protein
MVVVLGTVAGCERPGAAPTVTGSRSSKPAAPPRAGTPPAATPPACADLRNATVSGDEIPYRNPLTLADGRWWAPDGHIFLTLDPACVTGVLEACGRAVTVGGIVREAAGYPYSYRDIIVCPTVASCVVALSLGVHEQITSMTIEGAVLTVTSRSDPAGERTRSYVLVEMRLQPAAR